MPAPLIVTLFSTRWLHCMEQPLVLPGILKVPSGIHTVPPAPAAAMADWKAAVESAAPVGSAPLDTTDTEPDGWARAGATFSKSAKSIVVGDVAVSRNFVPCG